MGPEDAEEFELGVGRVFMVPLGPDGKPSEPREWGPLQEVRFEGGGFDWGNDRGYEEGLDGGLVGGPEGPLRGELWGRTWSMELKFSGEVADETMAILWGMSVEGYRDLKQWWAEESWLSRVLGNSWKLE